MRLANGWRSQFDSLRPSDVPKFSCFSAAGCAAVGGRARWVGGWMGGWGLFSVSRNAINKGNKVDLNHIINEIRDDRMALVQHTVYGISDVVLVPSHTTHSPAIPTKNPKKSTRRVLGSTWCPGVPAC